MNNFRTNVEGQDIQAELVLVTPELAQLWLEHNTGNRNMRNAHVGKLARSMQLGEFEFVGDPIRIAESGRLLDGQHRLAAIVRSRTAQHMLVIKGLAEDTQQYMDIGKVRSPADAVRLEFPDAKYTDKWASIARLAIKWDAGDMPSDLLVPSSPELIAFIRDNLSPVERAVNAAVEVRRGLRTGSSAACGAAFYFAEQIDANLAHDFWRRLATGAGIETGEPVYTLRTALLHRRDSQRWTTVEELAAYVRCWNLARSGKKIQKLQLTRGDFTEANFKLR